MRSTVDSELGGSGRTTRMPADCMPRVSPPFDCPASSASISRSAIDALAVLVGRGHRLHHLLARQRVALHGEILAGDVAGIAAEVNGIVRVGVAVDHALAGVDRRSALGVDDRHLPRVAAGIFVGDVLHDLGRAQPLLQQRDGLRTVERLADACVATAPTPGTA